MRLQGKTAIVTGGASGIGKATAELFAREGAAVVVADLDETNGRAVVKAITDAGGQAIFAKVNVADPAHVQAMVESALATFDGVDILFNNAAILIFGSILDTDLGEWRRVLDINLTGVYLCSRAVIPHMKTRGGGAIINMSSSTGAHDGNANAAAYVTSKGGVTLLTRCMAIDHAADNIRVNAIAPGPTDTPMLRRIMSPAEIDAFAASFPTRRLGRVEEIAAVALFLASDEASFVTGSIVAADGGQTAQV
ncbi:MAG: glucose 1-dehydrogenase [Caldilineaceae bacterium]|nr:glucose 1-dehydrogenase [Caldilineaceae bacterium]